MENEDQELHEEPGWPTPEEEAALDRVNDRIAALVAAGEVKTISLAESQGTRQVRPALSPRAIAE